MELSYRMKQIADCVTDGMRIADVGTDHGFIPIYLVEEGRIPSAIAMDIGEGPLKRASDHVCQHGLNNMIECRISDGLMNLRADEADTIIISGMGGGLMSRILEAGESVLLGNKELVLQPQSENYKIRKTLHNMHYRIVEERFFQDEGKYYNIIKAHPGEERYEFPWEYTYGKLLLESADIKLKEFIKNRYYKWQEICLSLQDKGAGQTEKQNRRYKELSLELKELERLLKVYWDSTV